MSRFITINSKRIAVDLAKLNPNLMLSDWIRDTVGLKGTKVSCGSGLCGACTVLINGKALNSCITPIGYVVDSHVTTIEGISDSDFPDLTHRVQAMHASQCGFCTPGFVVKTVSELCNKGVVTEASLHDNICRCTGYRPLADFCKTLSEVKPKLNPPSFSPSPSSLPAGVTFSDTAEKMRRFSPLSFRRPSFSGMEARESVALGGTYFEPCTMEEVRELRREHPNAVLSFCPVLDVHHHHYRNNNKKQRGGNNEEIPLMVMVSMVRVESLNHLSWDSGQWSLQCGSNTPLVHVVEEMRHSPHLAFMAPMLERFATHSLQHSNAIRVGHLFNQVTNMAPLLRSVNAKVEWDNAIPISILFTAPKEDWIFYNLFTGLTLDDNFTMCLAVSHDAATKKIRFHRVEAAIGGQTQLSLTDMFVENFRPKMHDANQMEEVARNLVSSKGELIPYRYVLANFLKFMADTIGEGKHQNLIGSNAAGTPITGSQIYQVSEGLPAAPHSSGKKHADGVAVFADDVIPPQDTLHAAHVLSKVPRGKFLKVDASEALKMPGVRGYFDSRDLAPLDARFKKVNDDTEKIFATGFVRCVGEVIGLVVADSREQALAAAEKVQVEIQALQDACISFEEGILRENFYPYDHQLHRGNVEDVDRWDGEDSIRLGGQLHWYMEPHALFVVPQDRDEMTVISCTQCVMKTQNAVSGAIGVPVSNVNVVVKRIGGGFGGKETLSTYTAARLAVAAKKLNRPVKILLSREEDTLINGGRHPFRGDFKVRVADNSLKLEAYSAHLYSDGGCTISTTRDVMDRALCHAHNSYDIANFFVKGTCVRTNKTSNTAYRGFGAPQAQFFMESAIDYVARMRGVSPEEVREANMFSREAINPSGQKAESPIREMWNTLKENVKWNDVRKEVDQFNANSKWEKQGISMIPTTYGISFPVSYLNASNAYVRIYLDGSVLITHSATEMGQGVNVKMCAIAAKELGVPLEMVKIRDTNSSEAPNAPPTAASVGSDLSGGAVLDACKKLSARLAPYRGSSSFGEAVRAAYHDRVSLAAEGYYRSPSGAQFKWNKSATSEENGDVYTYFSHGVCFSRVALNVVTGHYHSTHCSILMDVGRSLNPAIDIGQVEGAFLQGAGLFCRESLARHPTSGALESVSLKRYHVPRMEDVPRNFDVELWRFSENHKAVHSSKAVGEPPLFLGYTMFAAAKDAIYAARKDVNGKQQQKYIRCNAPLLPNDVLAAIARKG